jgi:peptide deformylase
MLRFLDESGVPAKPGRGSVSVRPIRYLGDPVLRTACDPVRRFDDALASLVADLVDTVQEPGRAGLAANQIGSCLAVFSYNVEGHLGYLINPQIVELDGSDEGPEGCLSIPGITAMRTRAARAVATGLNLDQERVTVAGTGELARCLQHETDHLSGELFIDRLASAERRRVMRNIHAEQIIGGAAPAGRPAD